MEKSDLEQFKALYLSTGKEYIEKLKESVEVLRQDPTRQESLDSFHISAHSLKSQSLVMGFVSTGELAHSLERFARSLKEKTLAFPVEHAEKVTKIITELEGSLNHIETIGTENEMKQSIQEFEEVIINL